MVKVGSYFLNGDNIRFTIDEGFIEGLDGNEWDEISSIHMCFIHKLLLRYDSLLFNLLFFLLTAVPLALSAHQLNQRLLYYYNHR